MEDREIIKALECCSEDGDCKHCPYYVNERYKCGEFFNKDVLNLINRQKAENEALKTENKQLQSDVIIEKQNYEHIKELLEIEKATVKRANERFFKAKKDLQEANAEIERLETNLKEAFAEIEELKRINLHCESEAVKEFAERLKEKVESYDVYDGYKITIRFAVEEDTIDNLVKEMVGETDV